jgi:hypothetical protein
MCPHTAVCVLILLYSCPHTAVFVSSYCCICFLILLYMCSHPAIYVSSYCCTCVLILLYVSSCCYICVFKLLYMGSGCIVARTRRFHRYTVYVSSYYLNILYTYCCICVLLTTHEQWMQPRSDDDVTAFRIRILLYICPHTTVCIHTATYACSY